MELTQGTVVAERFRLVRKLGEGGMGSVWLSHHVKLDTPCAVKFIHADVASASGVKERFEREAKIAAQLRSPHVVHVLDYGVCEGVPYIAMEYLEGEDLAQRLAQRGRITPQETVTLVAQVARALAKAHAAGLVHRDLKPENVFLVRDDDAELVKVLDFGIAKAQVQTGDASTRTGALMGTPRYMSPEQAQGMKNLDHRSDLWSLAVIAYRCIVGQLPFDSEALGDLLMRIMVHPLPIPSRVLPGIPESFDQWWARGVAREPAQRFQSARELSEALSAAFGLSAAISGPMGAGGAGGRTPMTTPTQIGYATPALTPHGISITPSRGSIGDAPGASAAATMLPMSGETHPSAHPPAAPSPTVVDPTMRPASRTFGGEAPKKAAPVARYVIGALLVIGACGAAAFFATRAPSEHTVAATSAAPSASAPIDVRPAEAASAPASSAPPVTASATPSSNATPHIPARTRPPPPPPPPARTGKVRIPSATDG